MRLCVFVVRTDKGGSTFNFSEWLGNGSAVAISNLYYPGDTRNVSDNIQKLGIAVGTDAHRQNPQGILAGHQAQADEEEVLAPAVCYKAHFATIRVDEHNGSLSTERRIRSPGTRTRHGGLPRATGARNKPEATGRHIAQREIHWFEKWKQVLDWQPPSRSGLWAQTNVFLITVWTGGVASQKRSRFLWEGRPGEQRATSKLLRLVRASRTMLKAH